jgi:methionine-rich copper-binding protein CopC
MTAGALVARSWRSVLLGVAAAAVIAAVVVGTMAGTAAAHVELTQSQPQNVGTATAPVSEIRLTFSAAADAVPDRFELRDTTSATVPIASIENDGEAVLVVTPETPLTSGRSRLTWAIRSGDSHTMSGSISSP